MFESYYPPWRVEHDRLGRGTTMAKLAMISISVLLLFGCSSSPEKQEMVFVEGGSFRMGNEYEGGDEDERPVHGVELDPYFIGRCEVTVGEFREFIESTGYMTTAEQGEGASVFIGNRVEKNPDASWKNPYFDQDDSHPVVCVSWYDAVEYCNWRSRSEGLTPCYRGSGDSIICDFTANGYRLPTEAEWEYAARSRGMSVKYAWGDGLPFIKGMPAGNTRDEAAHREWNLDNYWEGYDDGFAYTAPAGFFAPNSLGVHDVSGSVYEWCWDWYGETYYAESPAVNPTGPPTGEMHACRDAGYACSIASECVASRGKGKPTLTFSWGGFRVARSSR
jgi:formylglycine-generating enzyme required for sulfatase activity